MFLKGHFSYFLHVLCYFFYEFLKDWKNAPSLTVCSTFRFRTGTPPSFWELIPQIVDRDSGNLYPIYPPFPCSDFYPKGGEWCGWGGGGCIVIGCCLIFYEIYFLEKQSFSKHFMNNFSGVGGGRGGYKYEFPGRQGRLCSLLNLLAGGLGDRVAWRLVWDWLLTHQKYTDYTRPNPRFFYIKQTIENFCFADMFLFISRWWWWFFRALSYAYTKDLNWQLILCYMWNPTVWLTGILNSEGLYTLSKI